MVTVGESDALVVEHPAFALAAFRGSAEELAGAFRIGVTNPIGAIMPEQRHTLERTLHALGSAANARRLLESITQADAGLVKERPLAARK
ncbi:hypothetical protein [Paractinoplanes brasiliensis]|uniref:Uncharacterized protein n=1 Tax=Paractinoplanes brasiliensis TaxID=52695 RepID=A0A4V3C7Q3_9ACTN|nr:hypothetical protein [Actinoplanes brasiliensis]TDO38518.1 hypothetical protein C8E87_2175 [Actinoplanes brasiliensis]GID26709.1 hypothetical protein Abr02nite_16920 [Actinoplanes brasiliensis]